MEQIELVIKIPEEMYQKIKETYMIIGERRSGRRFDYILFNAVNTGTPLPKGHGDLIDRNELTVDYTSYDWDDYVSVEQIKNARVVVEADKENE